MIKIDNSEAYDTISWILDNADMGFFIATASPHMQRKIAKIYSNNKVAAYDFSQVSRPYSFSDLGAWADSHKSKDIFFILNMQLAFMDEKGYITEENMLSFNMSRDMLTGKRKLWIFFMTKDADYRLSTFAYDMYSYVSQKTHFQDEEESDFEGKQLLEFEERHNILQIKEMLARYKDLEERYMVLSLDETPNEQLLSSAVSLMNIATLYRDCADYENALRLWERIKTIREKVLGWEHTDTATSYNNIGFVYERQGDYNKALEWHEMALAIREKVLGKEHKDTAISYNNIAMVYYNQGDYNKALEWYVKSYSIVLRILGEAHPNTTTVRINMETAYKHVDHDEPFEQWLQRKLGGEI